jgi:hypothetical protein
MTKCVVTSVSFFFSFWDGLGRNGQSLVADTLKRLGKALDRDDGQ